MKVFVTGAGGFIGSHLVELLVEKGHDVVCLLYEKDRVNNLSKSLPVKREVGDVRDFSFVKRAMKGCDWVFHLAAAMNSPKNTFQDFFSTNVEGTRNVMEAAIQNGVKKVVHVSSIVTIKEDAKKVDERHIHSGQFDGGYSLTKFLGEKIAFEHGATGLPVVVVNPTVVYGPRAHALTDFFKLHIEPKIRFLGFATGQLNMIYVKDTVQGILLAMERGRQGHKYILGGPETTIGQFVSLLDKLTGNKRPVIKIPEYMIDIGSTVLPPVFSIFGKKFPLLKPQVNAMKRGSAVDIAKAKKELGIPITPLEKGVSETLQWYKETGRIRF